MVCGCVMPRNLTSKYVLAEPDKRLTQHVPDKCGTSLPSKQYHITDQCYYRMSM